MPRARRTPSLLIRAACAGDAVIQPSEQQANSRDAGGSIDAMDLARDDDDDDDDSDDDGGRFNEMRCELMRRQRVTTMRCYG